MKKYLLLPALVAVTILSSFAARPEAEDTRAQREFQKQFNGAQAVKWTTEHEGIQKVSFVWGGVHTVAYFSGAELVGSVRNIFYDHLPLSVIRAVESRFANPVVIEVTEVSTPDGTTYKILLDEKSKRFQTRFTSYGDILERSKVKK